jgi:hypothetical protein
VPGTRAAGPSARERGGRQTWLRRRRGGLLPLLWAAAEGRADLELAAIEGVVPVALASGLGPLLVRAVALDRERTRSPAWPALHAADLEARVLAAARADALTALLDACGETVGRVVLLKGMALAHRHYPGPHLRPMRDLDVLVDRAAVPGMEAVLRAQGYRPRSTRPPEYYDTHHHGMPFLQERTGIVVEVHHALFPPRSPLARDAVFARGHLETALEPLEVHGRRVWRLSDELQLVHTAAHWASDFQLGGGVLAMLDLIYLIGGKPERLRWDVILRWLRGAAAAAPVYLLLSYVHRRRLVPCPREVLGALHAGQRSFGAVNLAILHGLVDRYVVGGRPLGWLVSARNFEIAWRTLLGPGPPWRNLLCLPWNLWPRRWRPALM